MSEPSQNIFKHFFETYPLLQKMLVELPEYRDELFRGRIDFRCDVCSAVTPFRDWRIYGSGAPGSGGVAAQRRRLTSGSVFFDARCQGCEKMIFECWYEVNVDERWVRKLGQSPPWSTDIPKALRRELGEDAGLYAKALTLLSQSYGIGACAYLRRIIETHVDSMLRQIIELRGMQGLPEPGYAVDALAGRDFASKIRAASEAIPESLIVGGVNPVKLIYDKLSIGIHRLNEDEAVETARALRTAYEYVVTELRRQLRAKNEFIEAVKGLAQDQ